MGQRSIPYPLEVKDFASLQKWISSTECEGLSSVVCNHSCSILVTAMYCDDETRVFAEAYACVSFAFDLFHKLVKRPDLKIRWRIPVEFDHQEVDGATWKTFKVFGRYQILELPSQCDQYREVGTKDTPGMNSLRVLKKCWSCGEVVTPAFTQESWDKRIAAVNARLTKMPRMATLSAYWCPHCFETERVCIAEVCKEDATSVVA